MEDQQGVTVWLTGLSGAGKTTIAKALEKELRARRNKVEVLDGDVMREKIGKELGFSKGDRDENILRIGFVAHLLTRNGVLVVVAAISPYRDVRTEVRQLIEGDGRPGHFFEVYVDCPLEVCERRDPKGLYKKARMGEIINLTGLSDPYEHPLHPDLVLHTAEEDVHVSVSKIIGALENKDLLL